MMNIPSYLSGAVFMKAYRVLRIHVAGQLDKFKLTPTAWVLLGVIKDAQDGTRLADAANMMNVQAPLITTIAHALTQRGLVKRIEDRSDKRAKLLMLTPKGQVFVDKVEAELDRTLRALLKGLNETDMLAYAKVMQAIIANGDPEGDQSFQITEQP